MMHWMLMVAAFAGDEQPVVDLAEEADLQFDMGVKAYNAGRFEEALEHLLVSHRLVPNRNVVFNLATAYEQLERFEQAYRHYSEVVRTEPDAKKRKAAEEALDRISGRVARVSVETSPPGAVLYVDRKDLGSRGVTPMTLALPEGDYNLILELGGWKPAEEQVTLQVGAVSPVEVKLDPAESVATSDAISDDGTVWTSAAVRAGQTVLLRVSPVGCSLMPGVLKDAGSLDGRLAGTPSGSSAASMLPNERLVVDWTVDDGSVWRHLVPRIDERGLVLGDADALRPLLEACSPEGAKVSSLSKALGEMSTDERREAIAFFAEWVAVRQGRIDASMLEACSKGDCKGLAGALLK